MAKKPPTLSAEALAHEAETLATKPKELLARITNLAEQQLALEKRKKELKLQTTANNIANEILRGGPGQEGKLPQAMQEAGMTEFTLEANGAKVSVDDVLELPSMAADSLMREPMIKWLEANGNGSMVKNLISIPFEKGDARAKIVEDGLIAEGISYEKFQSVNANSLKALINEMLQDGQAVPMEELGISIYRQSKVK